VRHGEPSETLPNTLNVRFEGLRGDRVLDETDAVAASTGSACHEGGEPEPSSVLTAMGVDPEAALGSVRLSLGEMTTEEEIDRAGPALVETARQLREGETPAAQEESGNF
jgi:cysteine desulfurase